MIDERLETLALNTACIVVSAFTAFVLGMWAKTDAVDPAAVVGLFLMWPVVTVAWLAQPRRGLS